MIFPLVIGVGFLLLSLTTFRWPRILEKMDEQVIRSSAEVWERLGIRDTPDSIRQRLVALHWGVPAFFAILGFVWIIYSQS